MNNQQEIRDARLAMHGRILRCPVGDNPPDCPLYTVRQLTIEERLAWLAQQTDEEILTLYAQHVDCLDVKVNDGPAD